MGSSLTTRFYGLLDIRYPFRMAIKAVCVDEAGTVHLIIGLNRENIDSLLKGDLFTLPRGVPVRLSAKSDVTLVFAETDDDLDRRLPGKTPTA